MKLIRCSVFFFFLLTLLLISFAVKPFPAPAGELRITASVYPISLLLKSLCHSIPNVRISLLLPAGTGCPHDYAMTASERKILADTDILVINGLGLEEFLPEFSNLKSSSPCLQIIDSSKSLKGLLSAESTEKPHHNHYNPHIFASPSMMADMVLSLAEQLAELDKEYASIYIKNGEKTASLFNNLLHSMQKKISEHAGIIVQHSIFDYLARDLGLTIHAHIQKSEGQQPSASEMIALAKLAKEKHTSLIVTEPQYPVRTGQTLAQEIGKPCITLDPIATGPANADLLYYEKIMLQNAEILKNALQR